MATRRAERPARGAATLRDVARAAGVHPSTASRSLDPEQAGRVSQQTRARVLRAARALDYQPDLVASGLRRQRTHTVGILVPDLGNPVFTRLIRGINAALERRGCMSLVVETEDDPARLQRTLGLFSRRRVDAVITACTRQRDRATLRRYARRGVPIVMAMRWIGDLDLPTVANDDLRGGALAARHLIDLGHRRLAQLHGPTDIDSFLERGSGFRESARRAGLEPVTQDSATAGVVGEGRRLMRLLLGSSAEPPTGVFAHNDLMAIGAIEALAEHGLACPRDVSIIGYNDIPLTEHLDPPLSTIRMPVTDVGRVAAETALAVVEDGDRPAREAVAITLQPALVARGSTAPPLRRPGERPG
jgi:LacI family transcriptional regulator